VLAGRPPAELAGQPAADRAGQQFRLAGVLRGGEEETPALRQPPVRFRDGKLEVEQFGRRLAQHSELGLQVQDRVELATDLAAEPGSVLAGRVVEGGRQPGRLGADHRDGIAAAYRHLGQPGAELLDPAGCFPGAQLRRPPGQGTSSSSEPAIRRAWATDDARRSASRLVRR
jgi:hypothetical protein